MKKVFFSLVAILATVFSARAYDAPEGYDKCYLNMGEGDYLASTIEFEGGGSLTVNIYKNGISFYAQDLDFGQSPQMTFGDVTLRTTKDRYGEVDFQVKSPQTIANIIKAASSGSVKVTLSNGKTAVWSGAPVNNLKAAINLVKKSPSGAKM